MDDLVIYHHGVKGQKWGVRRTPAQLGHKISKSIKKRVKTENSIKNESNAKPKVKPRTKSISEMSDQEIRDRIERLKLEQSLMELTPQKMSRGRRIANSILNDMAVPSAKEIGKQVVKAGMAKALNEALNLSNTEYKIYTNNQKKK